MAEDWLFCSLFVGCTDSLDQCHHWLEVGILPKRIDMQTAYYAWNPSRATEIEMRVAAISASPTQRLRCSGHREEEISEGYIRYLYFSSLTALVFSKDGVSGIFVLFQVFLIQFNVYSIVSPSVAWFEAVDSPNKPNSKTSSGSQIKELTSYP